MKKRKVFIVEQHGILFVLNEKQQILYEARNRQLYFAMEECKIFLSSFVDIEMILDENIERRIYGKK